MKSLLTIVISFLSITIGIYGQCNCSALPPANNPVMVSSVAELQNALSQANVKNGNMTILISKGTYILNSNLLYIDVNMKNLTIRGATGNRDDVVIKGQGMNGGVTHIFNVAAAHFTVADMTIGAVYYHAIQIHGETNADSALIHNVKIIDANEQFIKISGDYTSPNIADGGIIECCYFEFSAGIGNQYYTGGVDGHHCSNWIVRNNIFKHLRSPDGNLAEHAIHFWTNSRDIITENNLIIDCDRGIGYGLGNDSTRGDFGGIIRNNFVHTSRDVGIGIEYSKDVKIFNNTVWTDNYFNSIEYRFAGNTNTHIANNLTNQNIALRDGAQGLLENNYTKAAASMFVNSAFYDYHLVKNNPLLIGKGKQLKEVTLDYDCLSRGTTMDIGADQFEVHTASNVLSDSNLEIYIFPNPASQFITIGSSDKITEHLIFRLYNSYGQLLLNEVIKEQKQIVRTNCYASGVYVYFIFNERKMISSGNVILNQ